MTIAAQHEADADEDDISWQQFRDAVHACVHASCCGSGALGVMAATRSRSTPALLAYGYRHWASTVRKAPPLLPWRGGSFVLKSVLTHEPGVTPTAPVDMLIADGRIAQIAPAGAAHWHEPEIASLRGQVVAPAIADLHVHMPAANALRLTPLFMLLMLRHGVVRARDAGDPDGTATPAALRLVLSGALPGPELHYAYSFVGDGRARWANTLRLKRPGDAPEVIAQLQHAGATWVKAYENLDAPRIAALVAAASEVGLKVMGHVPTALAIEDAGIPDPQHGFGVPRPHGLRRDHVLSRAIDWSSVTPQRIAEVVDACQRQGLAFTPTLSSSRGLMRLQNWADERDAHDARLLPRMYSDVVWHPQHGLPAYRGMTADDYERAHDAWGRKLSLVAALADAGVPLRLGTDTQQPFVVPGAALHAEIAAFAQAGISRSSSWRMASRDAAQTLGVSDAGRLAVGQRADMLVTPRSPFDPGWSPREISATICAGACLMAKDLDAAVDQALSRFEGRIGDHVSRWLARFALDRTARNFVG